jgi:plasmid stabilization system protein ParE
MDEIVWSDDALQALDDIGDYILLDSPRAAEKVVRRIVETVAALAFHPKWAAWDVIPLHANWSLPARHTLSSTGCANELKLSR